MRPILFGPSFGHRGRSPIVQGRKGQEQVACAVALIFSIETGRLTGFNRQRFAGLTQKLLIAFVHTDQRVFRAILAVINIQNVFHLTHKSRVGFRRDTPFFFEPRPKFVLFSVWRTVSSEMRSTISRVTNLSAKSCMVQSACPVGGSLQAKAIKCASTSPVMTTWLWPVYRPCRTELSPRSRYRFRTPDTVSGWTSRAVAITASLQAGPSALSSAFSKIWARFIARTFTGLCINN